MVLGREDGCQLLEGRDWQRHHLVCSGPDALAGVQPATPAVRLLRPPPTGCGTCRLRTPRAWEDSPDGWPQPWGDAKNPEVWRTDGRPIAQWSRIEAGRSDELT